MKDLKPGIRILVWIIITVLLGIWIGITSDRKDSIVTTPSVPPCPDMSKPMYYDFYKEKWEYLYRNDRANGLSSDDEPYMTEDELEDYLEKHIDGYLEDTYWGEEYDLDDNE